MKQTLMGRPLLCQRWMCRTYQSNIFLQVLHSGNSNPGQPIFAARKLATGPNTPQTATPLNILHIFPSQTLITQTLYVTAIDTKLLNSEVGLQPITFNILIKCSLTIVMTLLIL